MTNKEYIGDGVYAALDDLKRIILTTEDGISATNTIVLEPEVANTLAIYMERVYGRKANT